METLIALAQAQCAQAYYAAHAMRSAPNRYGYGDYCEFTYIARQSCDCADTSDYL